MFGGQVKKNEHFFYGFNSRLDELHACVLRIKLSRLEQRNETRRKISNEGLEKTKLTTENKDGLFKGLLSTISSAENLHKKLERQYGNKINEKSELDYLIEISGIGKSQKEKLKKVYGNIINLKSLLKKSFEYNEYAENAYAKKENGANIKKVYEKTIEKWMNILAFDENFNELLDSTITKPKIE